MDGKESRTRGEFRNTTIVLRARFFVVSARHDALRREAYPRSSRRPGYVDFGAFVGGEVHWFFIRL